MAASSPVTMADLVSGLTFTMENGQICSIELVAGDYKITDGTDGFNTVSISSDGLTVTFGSISSGPTLTSFTFVA